MARNPIAEVYSPGKASRCPVGVVWKAREKAAPTTDGDAERQRRNELPACRTFHARQTLVRFDRDNAPGDCSRNGMTKNKAAREIEIYASAKYRARDRADGKRNEIDRVAEGRARLAKRGQPSASRHENSDRGARQPGENVEYGVDDHCPAAG